MNSSQGQLLRVILASLALHSLLFYLIAQREVFGPSVSVNKSTANVVIEPIKARLLFAPIATDEVIEEEPQAKVVSPAEQQDEVPLEITADVPAKQKTTQPLPTSALTSDPVAGATSDNTKQPATHSLSAGELAKRQLRGYQQRQLDSLSKQAATSYQQHKNSPVLKGKKIDPFVTEDEKLRASNRITVNCSSSINKTAAVMLSLFGGTLKCSQPPAVKVFIQNRLNKTQHLPAKYEPIEGR